MLNVECSSSHFKRNSMDDITVAIRIEVHLNPLMWCSFEMVAIDIAELQLLLMLLLLRTSLSPFQGCYHYTLHGTSFEKVASVLFAWMNLICKCSCHRSSIAVCSKRVKRATMMMQSNTQKQTFYLCIPTMLIWKLIWIATGEKYHFNISNWNVSIFLSFSTIILNSRRIP